GNAGRWQHDAVADTDHGGTRIGRDILQPVARRQMVGLAGEVPWRRGALAGGFECGECTIDRLVGHLLPEVAGGAEYAARPGPRLDEEPVAAVRTRQRIDPHPIGEAPYRIFPIWHVERVDRRCALRARRGIVAVVIESDAPPQPVVRL